MENSMLSIESSQEEVLQWLLSKDLADLKDVFQENHLDGEDFFGLEIVEIKNMIPVFKLRKRFIVAWSAETRMIFDLNGKKIPGEPLVRGGSTEGNPQEPPAQVEAAATTSSSFINKGKKRTLEFNDSSDSDGNDSSHSDGNDSSDGDGNGDIFSESSKQTSLPETPRSTNPGLLPVRRQSPRKHAATTPSPQAVDTLMPSKTTKITARTPRQSPRKRAATTPSPLAVDSCKTSTTTAGTPRRSPRKHAATPSPVQNAVSNNWLERFMIPERWTPEVERALQKGVLTPLQQNSLVRQLCITLRSYTDKVYIADRTTVAIMLMEKYPFLKGTYASGIQTWAKKIEEKFLNQNRTAARNKKKEYERETGNVLPKGKPGRRPKASQSSNVPEIPEGETVETLAHKQQQLKTVCKKKPIDQMKARALMDATYPKRRREVLVANERVWKVIADYPALKDLNGVEIRGELERILGRPKLCQQARERRNMKLEMLIKGLEQMGNGSAAVKAILADMDSLDTDNIEVQSQFALTALTHAVGERKARDHHVGDMFLKVIEVDDETDPAKVVEATTSPRIIATGKAGQFASLCIAAEGMVVCKFAKVKLKYLVDPSYMQSGEIRVFSRYLLAQSIHMDVWDGDSLLLIGSLSLELKHLLRQGREAVLVSHEADIVTVEFSDDTPAVPGDVTRTGTVRPVGMKAGVKGLLHIRMANIGHHSEMPNNKIATVPKKRSHVIMSETIRGSMPGLATVGKALKSKAKPMAECDGELASVLFSRQEKISKGEKTVKQDDAIRKRKLERMQAVRQTKGADNKIESLVIQKEEKLQRARDLKTIQLYRGKNKHEGIMSLLCANITTTHTIYPSFGTAEFFEFAIRNPYNTEQTISIQCDDNELSVITDTREWRHFKKFTDTFSAIEENMLNTADTPYPEVFLRPRESVHVPFKFQTFKADHSVPEQGPSHPLRQDTSTYRKFASVDDNKLQPRTIKVSFVMKDNRPVAILQLTVEPRPHVIDQTFRFYHPEQSFLKKSIRLPPWHSLPGAPVIDDQAPPLINVRCSDVNVICEAKRVQPTEPQDVFMKVACGPSPSVKRYFVLLFIDPFMATPCQTWQFYVHSLQRVDISAVEGQSSRLSVILRGTQSSRLVQCHSSHPDELQVAPADPFMLMANAVHEVHLTLTPLTSGSTRYMYVNVVDTEFHQLVRTWLVCASCQQPVISKAFELQLQVGGGKGSNKRVSFTNPYPTRKVFHLSSNRPDLLQFKENSIEVGPGEAHNIGLRFAPQPTALVTQILIFINDSEGKNEETFSITAVYR